VTVDLRPMRWWDIEPVMRLEHQLFAEDAWTATLFWSELAERASRHYVVAADADDVVGYAGLCVYSIDQAYVQTIGVDEARQGAGIGRALLRALLAEADDRGCRHVDLEVRADNARAIGIYEMHGFRSIGRRRGYYQPSGADAVVMRRDRPADLDSDSDSVAS
jgi:[ribosomal protein S18]-alanine N-acetyltransferase